MRISEITHERVRNLGNYESARVALTAILDEDDDPRAVFAALKVEAKKMLFPEKTEKK